MSDLQTYYLIEETKFGGVEFDAICGEARCLPTSTAWELIGSEWKTRAQVLEREESESSSALGRPQTMLASKE
jgi:hypothetical protein